MTSLTNLCRPMCQTRKSDLKTLKNISIIAKLLLFACLYLFTLPCVRFMNICKSIKIYCVLCLQHVPFSRLEINVISCSTTAKHVSLSALRRTLKNKRNETQNSRKRLFITFRKRVKENGGALWTVVLSLAAAPLR